MLGKNWHQEVWEGTCGLQRRTQGVWGWPLGPVKTAAYRSLGKQLPPTKVLAHGGAASS